MSKIEDMIRDLCPEGGTKIKLGDIESSGWITLGRGKVISKEDIRNTPGDYPVYSSSSQGNGEIGRFGEYMFDDERISWSIDGGGRFFYRANHKYSITNVSGWIVVNNTNVLSTKYLYYALVNEWQNKVYDYNHKAHPSVIRDEYEIPLPPLPIQEKIVEILDKFSLLSAELEAELEGQKKRYDFYRNRLLSFDSGSDSVQWKALGEVGEFIKGSGILKSDFVEDGLPCIHYGQVHTRFNTFAYKNISSISEDLYKKCKTAHTGDLIIASTSEDVEACCKAIAWLGNFDVAVSGDAHIFRHNQNSKYVASLFQTEMFQTETSMCEWCKGCACEK